MKLEEIRNAYEELSGIASKINRQLAFAGIGIIPFGKILSITPYSDGVGIEKDSGRSPVFQVSDDASLLAMYISRLIKDFNG